jgi:hypothetical protein
MLILLKFYLKKGKYPLLHPTLLMRKLLVRSYKQIFPEKVWVNFEFKVYGYYWFSPLVWNHTGEKLYYDIMHPMRGKSFYYQHFLNYRFKF